MKYDTAEKLLEALKQTPKGKPRADILAEPQNRALIQSSGANVTLYSGNVKSEETIKGMLSNIYVGLIARLNSRTGKPDGIGGLGGLSERTMPDEFQKMTEDEKFAAEKYRDDIIIKNGKTFLTFDINLIRIKNVLRETKEELNNLGIYDFSLNAKDMKLVEMPGIKDDNYIINIWEGKKPVWTITPYCHTLKVTEQTIDNLVQRSKNTNRHEQNSEAANFIKLPLFEALKAYGRKGGKNKLEDGRCAEQDYRYPHEWLAAWFIAAKALRHNDEAMLKLMSELQAETTYKISLSNAAEKMGKNINFIANVLKIAPKTIKSMENISPRNILLQHLDKNRQ